MPKTYTIEPPEERQREMSRDRKLDTIIDMLRGGGDHESSDGGAPEVTFEAEPEHLPVDPASNEPGGEEPEDEAGQGEGTENVSDQTKQEGGFRFPGRRRQAVGS